jgi:maltose O-acetyltransferase
MVIRGQKFTLKQVVCLVIYYTILKYLPESYCFLGGRLYKKIRYLCCKNIFKHCGKNVNIDRNANFGSGVNICIGNNSGLGINSQVPSDIIIGDNVLMGPNCYIFSTNHCFDKTDIPIINQGISPRKTTIIENDIWIGRDVIMTPGRHVKKGTIIGAGCVLSKNFPEYSIVGGNPSKLLRSRIK